jgi:hypothetical protein
MMEIKFELERRHGVEQKKINNRQKIVTKAQI